MMRTSKRFKLEIVATNGSPTIASARRITIGRLTTSRKPPERCETCRSDTAAENVVTKGEESLTKLHESRFLVSKWWWGILIAVTLTIGWVAVKFGRDYFHNVYVLGAPRQTFLLFAAVFFLFILAVCWP